MREHRIHAINVGAAVWLLAAGALSLATGGCKTFSYTDDDLARERAFLDQGMRNGEWRGGGWSGGLGPGIGKVDLGNLQCPRMGGGNCHGK